MIKEMNEIQTLTKHIYHSNVNTNFMLENVSQVNSELTINVDVNAKIQENITWVKGIIFGILLHKWTLENGEYLESLFGDSVIKCDEFIEVAKTTPTKDSPTNTAATKIVSTNLNKEKVTNEVKKFHILLIFLLVIIQLLIIVSTYCRLD